LLNKSDVQALTFHTVADAMLYMVIADGTESYNLSRFVTAVRKHKQGSRIDWQDVIGAFDRPDLRVTKSQFLAIYNSLLPVAKEVESFDIQTLWSGTWNHLDTQLSFVVAFLSTSADELDVTQTPRLRTCFEVAEFKDATPEVQEHAAKAVHHPLVSYGATQALFSIIFSSQEAYSAAKSLGIPEAVINANTDIFVCAASAIEKPWTPLQEQALKQLFAPFFIKTLPNYRFVMYALWIHDRTWLAARFIEQHASDFRFLTLVLEHAKEHDWISTLISVRNDFGLDFTALAHSQALVDMEKWAHDHTVTSDVPAVELSRAIMTFLRGKIEDELQVQRANGSLPKTMALKVKTVYALLDVIQGTVTEQEEGAVQRQCIQAYPRLINYGYKFDHIIDANGENGNALSVEADARMQAKYKDMYSGDADAREMIKSLRSLRDSEDSSEQELFACMIHGLFDEYNCFGEYPLEALATTAVLFGSIINYGILHSRITLSVALLMVVEAVAGFAPEDSMYRFGLQALIHFTNRLEEWPQLCERLCRIPGLRGTQVYAKAEEIVKAQAAAAIDESGRDPTNGNNDAIDADLSYPAFTSLTVERVLRPGFYEDPDEETSDKVTFVLNNVSKRNIEEKSKELKGHLDEKFHQWFANHLVDSLAKSQPNYQALYVQMLSLLDRQILWHEVLRETYASIAKIINAESTLTSASERSNLKNLAVWLGLLTLARNKPILHRQLSLRDLLIEAYQLQRLPIALPFTCKTLAQASQSTIFKLPNPWTMEILCLMMELYHFAELKLNLKFEIEVLCKELDVDPKTLQPLGLIRALPAPGDEQDVQGFANESIDGYGEILGLPSRANERLSTQEIMDSLPELANELTFPPNPSTIDPAQMQSMFLTATQRAIQEIITPVVERSVTIAAISSSHMVEKDFATELDGEKMQQAAHNVVKALSGSLALVTCKEPLRMSIMNNVRVLAAQNLPNQQLAEGTIVMFLNENLDNICKIVENSAERHSIAEVDSQLDHAIEARQRHRQARPHEPYNDPPVSRWAFFVPEPYRQDQGGLNEQQMAIYDNFGRQARPLQMPMGHASIGSQDTSRQLTDLMPDGFLPQMPTPAETPALPRQTLQQPPNRNLPPQAVSLQSQALRSQVNGYSDSMDVAERMSAMIEDLQNAAREASEEHIRDLVAGSPSREIYDQLIHLIDSSSQKDSLALAAGQRVTMLVFTEARSRLEVELFVQFLSQICAISTSTARQLIIYLSSADDDRFYDATVAVCLVRAMLLDLHHIDVQIAKAASARRPIVIDFFSALIDEFLLTDQPTPLRADFVLSVAAFSEWNATEHDNEKVRQVLQKLDLQQDSHITDASANEKHDQLEYVFEEWIAMQRSDVTSTLIAAFIKQLESRKIITGRNDFAILVRIACDNSVEAYDREAVVSGSLDHAYITVDAFAKLIVSFVVHSKDIDNDDEENSTDQRATLLEELLCFIVLVLNHHYVTRKERFSAKIYFRLISTMFVEFNLVKTLLGESFRRIPHVFTEALLTLQPQLFPGFAFQWISLFGHRIFASWLLSSSTTTIESGIVRENWHCLTRLLCTALSHLDELKIIIDKSLAVQDMYRAILRMLCIIQHDHAKYLAENHLFLNSAIPDTMIQLYNIVNCSNPSIIQDLPDPFTPGLKINRLDGVSQSPSINADCDELLSKAVIKPTLDRSLSQNDSDPSDMTDLLSVLTKAPSVSDICNSLSFRRALLCNSIMIYIGNTATLASSTFSAASPASRILERLLTDASPSMRYVLISSMVNQIRYPCSHTHYFSTAILHFFTVLEEDVQQQLARVLVERLLVARPHPWGLIVTVLELIKNTSRYNIFEQRWMKAAPEIERMLTGIAQTQGMLGGNNNNNNNTSPHLS